MPKKSDRSSIIAVDALSHHTLRRSPRFLSSCSLQMPKKSVRSSSIAVDALSRHTLRRSSRFLSSCSLQRPKKSVRSSSIAVDALSHHTLRRSPRFLSSCSSQMLKKSEMIEGDSSSVEVHRANLLKGSRKLNSISSFRVGSSQAPLRRSGRFLLPEKLKSAETISNSLSISSKLKQKSSDFGMVLEAAQNGYRRSPRLASETGTKAFESPQCLPHESRTSQSPSLLGKVPVGFFSTKTTEHHKDKKRKLEEDNGVKNKIAKIENADCDVTLAWTIEQEAALQKAYIIAKPTPHFWKKVSKMVPGKSAQDCFDKIFSSMATPLSSQFQTKTRRKSLSPICNFSFSDNISQVSELKVGRLGRTRTKMLAAQKISRHLLRKHYRTDQAEAIDRFNLLEPSPINIASIVHDILTPETLSLTSDSPLLPHNGDKLSFNSDLASRFKLLASNDPSPEVLKRIKNRALHDRYIDQLHHRDARRAVLAKKSNHGVVGKPDHGGLRAARTALISDAISFAKHFRDSQENPISESDEHDDIYDDDEDIDADE